MKPVVTVPEFCPNPACPFYDRSKAAHHLWYRHFGFFYTRCRGWIRRFQCKCCGKTCSTQTFSIHYWTHSTNDLVWLLHLLVSSSGLRQIGRFAGVSYRVIQNRIRRLARNSLSVMDLLYRDLDLVEDLVLDGFESYTRSQYHPNNFTLIAGSHSQFFYSVVHTLLRRKGAMRDDQKRMRALIDSVYRPSAASLRNDCALMLADLAPLILRRHTSVCWLYTDRHPAYPEALKRVPSLANALNSGSLIHHTTSSHAPRTRINPLFAVNYLDRQIRKNMGEHVRETVKQGREVNCQMERMAVFMFVHNFLTPHRIDDTADVAESVRHAGRAGVSAPQVVKRIKRFLTHRHIWGHCESGHQWMKRIWQHLHENPPALRLGKEGVVVRPVALPPRGLAAHFLA